MSDGSHVAKSNNSAAYVPAAGMVHPGPCVDLTFSILKLQRDPATPSVWLRVSFVTQPSLSSLQRSLPTTQVHYDDRLKLWLISFELYEHVVSRLTATEYQPCVRVQELLPRFLASGLSWRLRVHLKLTPMALLPVDLVPVNRTLTAVPRLSYGYSRVL